MKLFAASLPIAAALPCAAAQAPTPLVVEGDLVPGVGTVTGINHIALATNSQWLVEVDTDNADTEADSVIIRNGAMVLREGDPAPGIPGATLDSFDSLSLTPLGGLGRNDFLDGPPSGFDSAVYKDSTLLIQEGDLVSAAGITPGTPYIGFFDVKVGALDRLLVMASIDDPAIASSVDRALVILDASGGTLGSTTLVGREGEILPGQTLPLDDFETGPHSTAFQGQDQVMYIADLEGSVADSVIYLNDAILAQEGQPSPIAGRLWGSLAFSPVDLNSTGDYAFRGTLDGDPSTNTLIVKNGVAIVVEGDSLPAFAPFQLTSFGTGPVHVDRNGSVLWYGDWNDPDTDRDTGLFLDGRLLVQEGVTTVGGVVIDTLRGIQDGYILSRDGRFVMFEAILQNGDEGAFLLDLGLGTNYCTAVPNSSGMTGRIAASGSDIAGGNPLRLIADQLPINQFGFFVASLSQGNFPGIGGSQGTLCLGGTIGRFNSQIQFSGLAGTFEIPVDTLAIPLTPAVAIQAGETWNFQAWHRDFNPIATSNFTDGLSVPFQ